MFSSFRTSLLAQTVKVCLQCGRPRFDPWVGNDPLEKEMATHSSTLARKIPWRILVGYSPWGHKESDTTEQLHFTSLISSLNEVLRYGRFTFAYVPLFQVGESCSPNAFRSDEDEFGL